MKNNFTKLMAMLAILLISVWSVNAQTPSFTWDKSEITTAWANASAASTIKVMGGVTLEQIGTAGVVNNYIDLNNSNSNLVLNATGNDALTITSTDVITKIEMNFSGNSSSNTPNPYFGFHSVGTSMGSASATVSSCLQDATGVTGTTGITKTYIPPAGTKFAIIVRGKACDPIASSGATARIYNIKVYTQPAAPSITKFVAEGVEATINESAKTITAELPYGTSLTSIEPVVTIGGTATSYSPTGAQDFSGGAINYIATDGTPANDVTYAVTLTASTTASSEKDLSNVTIGGKTPTFDAGTNTYSITLPKAYDITSQVVTFTKPGTATANFTSGATHDFTNPLQITVTAQDLSTKVYTLTAQAGIADIAYVSTAATPHTNDTKIYPMLIEKGYYVNVIAASGTDLTQFNPYDIVVLCENVSSSNTLALAMNGLIKTKRFLSFKAFMYGKTGWPTGTPSDGTSDADVAIEADYLGHPIFSGVTLTGNLANILTAPAAKGVQGVLNPQENVSSKIAYLTSAGNADKVALIENNQMPTAKYLMIPIQTDSYAKVNANGLKLIENAISYLLTDSKFGPYTVVTKNNLTNISFDGRTILNPERQQLYVYNATGGLVASSVQDINMSAQAKGVYLVKGENGMMKIAVTN